MTAQDEMPFQEILEDGPFCQGDIVYRPGAASGEPGSFGMIITADCDIAQNKAGDTFSLVRLVTADSYICDVWAALELEKIIAKRVHSSLLVLNAAIKKEDTALEPLTRSRLIGWLESRGPDQIMDAVGLTAPSSRNECGRDLMCICDSLQAESDKSPIVALAKVWSRLGTPERNIRSRLSDILDPSRGAVDTYFLPYVPEFTDIGFVIQLRAITAVSHLEVFKSRTQARVAGAPFSYHRLGRLRDAVKYSVVQRIVQLFARVGLSEDYELESSSAAELVVDHIYSQIREVQ